MRPVPFVVLLSVCVGIGCGQVMPTTQADPPRSQEPPESLEELVRTINDDPDPLHADHTPSVHKLIELGDPAIPPMLDLMLLDGQYDRLTRLHAERVLWGIVMKKYGFVRGRGWSAPDGADRANAFWKSLGNLDWEAPREEREQAVKLWREWLAKGGKLPEKR
jgi:hypothetical protein